MRCPFREVEYFAIPDEALLHEEILERRRADTGRPDSSELRLLLIQETDAFAEELSSFAKQRELEQNAVRTVLAALTRFCRVSERRLAGWAAPIQDSGANPEVQQEQLPPAEQMTALRGQRHPNAAGLRMSSHSAVGSEKGLQECDDRITRGGEQGVRYLLRLCADGLRAQPLEEFDEEPRMVRQMVHSTLPLNPADVTTVPAIQDSPESREHRRVRLRECEPDAAVLVARPQPAVPDEPAEHEAELSRPLRG